MSIYFDFKTIEELIGDECYRQQREFTLEELSQYDGKNGRPAYIAVGRTVYDVSKQPNWAGGTNLGLTAGKDLTNQFTSSPGMNKMLSRLPRVGILKLSGGMTGTTGGSMAGGTTGGGMTGGTTGGGMTGGTIGGGMTGGTTGIGMLGGTAGGGMAGGTTGGGMAGGQKEFTLEELSQYDGRNGKPAYIAVGGIVYDVSKQPNLAGAITAGKDLTTQFNSSAGMTQMLNRFPVVGTLKLNSGMTGGTTSGSMFGGNAGSGMFGGNIGGSTSAGNTSSGMIGRNANNSIFMDIREMQNTSDFTPDDWVEYITPLVDRALEETKEGINQEHLYQEFILSGVLVGLGKTPQEAIDQVETWEDTGMSQLLAESKMKRSYYY